MTAMEMYNQMRDRILSAQDIQGDDSLHVEVQMGICSQAGGVNEVMSAMENAIFTHKIENVVIDQTGCGGFCAYEPLVILRKQGQKPVTYCKVTPERAGIIISEYALKGKVIEPWTLNGKDVML